MSLKCRLAVLIALIVSMSLAQRAGAIILADRANTHRMKMQAFFVRGVAEGPQSITFPDGNVFEGVFHPDRHDIIPSTTRTFISFASTP